MGPKLGGVGWSGFARLRADESGKSPLRPILTLLFVVGSIYLGLKFIPVRASAFQFDDAVRDQVVLAGSGRRRVGDPEILRKIIESAEMLELPITSKEVTLQRRDRSIRIEVKYTVPIHMIFNYTYNWDFHVLHQGPVF